MCVCVCVFSILGINLCRQLDIANMQRKYPTSFAIEIRVEPNASKMCLQKDRKTDTRSTNIGQKQSTRECGIVRLSSVAPSALPFFCFSLSLYHLVATLQRNSISNCFGYNACIKCDFFTVAFAWSQCVRSYLISSKTNKSNRPELIPTNLIHARLFESCY